MLQGRTLEVIQRALEICNSYVRPSRQLLDGVLRLLQDLNSETITLEGGVVEMLQLCLQAAIEGRLASPSFPVPSIRRTLSNVLQFCGEAPCHSFISMEIPC